MRKPNIDMAKRAKKDFPEIDFVKSIIVGDSISDRDFGCNAGMGTVFIGEYTKPTEEQSGLIDNYCESLSAFAEILITNASL